jgi:hypothetical protein
MATTNAIGATSMGILRLLTQAFDPDRFGGRVAFFALDFRTPITFGVSLFLRHIEVGGSSLRSLPHQHARDIVPASLPVDVHYLLTAWADEAHDQQALLGWAARTLHDTPILPPSLLNAQFPETFGADETVELSVELHSLSDLASLWALMAPNPQPSVAYVARGLQLASGAIGGDEADG